jgi:hypothetical protein
MMLNSYKAATRRYLEIDFKDSILSSFLMKLSFPLLLHLSRERPQEIQSSTVLEIQRSQTTHSMKTKSGE